MSSDSTTRKSRPTPDHWRRKPLLRRIYRDFYAEIVGELRQDRRGEMEGIGSGIGKLKTVVPEALATDLFPNPWLGSRGTLFSRMVGGAPVVASKK